MPRRLISAFVSRIARVHGLGRRKLAVLVIQVRNAVGGDLAGQFAGRVSPHAVGHHEQVAAVAVQIGRVGDHLGQRVLIRRAAHADVAQVGNLQARHKAHRCRLSLVANPTERSARGSPKLPYSTALHSLE